MTKKKIRIPLQWLLLFIGVALLYEFWPEYQRGGARLGVRGGDVAGEVVARNSSRGRARAGGVRLYEITYRYTVDGRPFEGVHSCRCDALRGLDEGDSVSVRYARLDPANSRPAGIYNRTWLTSGVLAGVAFSLAGALMLAKRKLWGSPPTRM